VLQHRALDGIDPWNKFSIGSNYLFELSADERLPLEG
jgi:hypothetical protein